MSVRNSVLAALADASPVSGIESRQAALAAELAAQILPVDEVISRYGLTEEELKRLLKNEQFKHMVREFRREWHSPLSSRERVKLKAALSVEDGLLDLHRMFVDPDLAPSARMDAYRELVKLADMTPKRDAEAPVGGGFSISISIPASDAASAKTVTLEHNPPTDIDDSQEVIDEQ